MKNPPRQSRSSPATFNELLEMTCRDRKSHLCVGLDPDPERLNVILGGNHGDSNYLEADGQFCLQAMYMAASAVAPYVTAFKPNAAFFEALDEDIALMTLVGRHLHAKYPDIVALCDAKRGDIGNTSNHYARAIFQNQEYDAVTVNPLMGSDAVDPFLKNPQNGVFFLCLTSNPGADDFLLKNDLYLRIAEKAVEWNTNGNVGLVVGATRPEYLARIREIAPELSLLIPGVGAQGGKLKETLDAIDARDNRKFLINASRSVVYPEGKGWATYAEDVATAAKELRDQINAGLA